MIYLIVVRRLQNNRKHAVCKELDYCNKTCMYTGYARKASCAVRAVIVILWSFTIFFFLLIRKL